MSFTSIPENNTRIETIVKFIESKKDGDTVTWMELEVATEIPMRPKAVKGIDGRALTRRALNRMKREVETIPGTGFRLSAPDSAVSIYASRMNRAGRALKRGIKSGGRLFESHGADMPAGQRDRLTRGNALLATLSSSVEDAKKALTK